MASGRRGEYLEIRLGGEGSCRLSGPRSTTASKAETKRWKCVKSSSPAAKGGGGGGVGGVGVGV